MAKVSESAVPVMEVWRGGLLECVHNAHAVICDAKGVVAAWGNPQAVIFPRSSAKMMQALPLLETGAADARGLSQEHLALACASHRGAHVHVDLAGRWLADLGLGESDLRCGAHEPGDKAERDRLIETHEKPCQLHNNCSGKHAGFLTLNRRLGPGIDQSRRHDDGLERLHRGKPQGMLGCLEAEGDGEQPRRPAGFGPTR